MRDIYKQVNSAASKRYQGLDFRSWGAWFNLWVADARQISRIRGDSDGVRTTGWFAITSLQIRQIRKPPDPQLQILNISFVCRWWLLSTIIALELSGSSVSSHYSFKCIQDRDVPKKLTALNAAHQKIIGKFIVIRSVDFAKFLTNCICAYCTI